MKTESYFDNFLDGVRFHQGRGDPLLDGDDNSLGGLDPDSRGAQLDGLDGVLDLEEATLGGEGVDAAVVLGSGEKHFFSN